MRSFAIALVVCAMPVAALAQGGPSFDCAKATSPVDHAICKAPEVAKADREMAAVYAALAARLPAQARADLAKDQVRWIANRNQVCSGDAGVVANCLKARYATRTANLRALGEGVYPFVGGQAIYSSGKVGKTRFMIDISYPQFNGTAADFSAANRRYADDAGKSASDATPATDSSADNEQEWSYEQSFTLHRPGTNAVTIDLEFYGYSGGAHGFGGTICTLVDLRSGRLTGPDGVFVAGDQWLKVMVATVGAALRKQFVKNPGFDDALEPATLGKMLSDASHYCWRADRLELIFNAYDVGPFSAGPYSVEISYSRLKPLLRTDGPLGR